MKHKVFLIVQAILIFATIIIVLIFYPRADFSLDGSKVSFSSINAEVIILSANPDFSNPRYVDVNDNVSFNLKPGIYYWKVSNDYIESFAKEFKIDSEVGLQIIEENGSQELKNIGDVKVNVTKTKDGAFVGYIILEPNESNQINDGNYLGRQDE